ncbi:hypothetical protein GOP47_0025309 [Adiantum capillus-veneris]|uniref:Uncharacterized protein n=1 Tax=Adiantum capillus-veneris TaxID=13818 RepID=A0A9D4Z2V4_ADICA|nr:hypothetical protein GOP47_0025309 [Adiantum capillus-veneris]
MCSLWEQVFGHKVVQVSIGAILKKPKFKSRKVSNRQFAANQGSGEQDSSKACSSSDSSSRFELIMQFSCVRFVKIRQQDSSEKLCSAVQLFLTDK